MSRVTAPSNIFAFICSAGFFLELALWAMGAGFTEIALFVLNFTAYANITMLVCVVMYTVFPFLRLKYISDFILYHKRFTFAAWIGGIAFTPLGYLTFYLDGSPIDYSIYRVMMPLGMIAGVCRYATLNNDSRILSGVDAVATGATIGSLLLAFGLAVITGLRHEPVGTMEPYYKLLVIGAVLGGYINLHWGFSRRHFNLGNTLASTANQGRRAADVVEETWRLAWNSAVIIGVVWFVLTDPLHLQLAWSSPSKWLIAVEVGLAALCVFRFNHAAKAAYTLLVLIVGLPPRIIAPEDITVAGARTATAGEAQKFASRARQTQSPPQFDR